MTDTATETTNAATGAETTTTEVAGQEQAATTAEATATQAGDQSADIERLNAEIARLRRENSAERVNAKQQAAQEAEKALLDKILAAAGRTPEGGEQPPTVEQLTQQLT
ncbi:hypothetical protein, partial [uncultured Aeromicrobium sp.]|uniref:hypothetical protein n=1 Tax=uncultured Aeromicrobium sp. TaxID=337820 RepID=UPI0025EDA98E